MRGGRLKLLQSKYVTIHLPAIYECFIPSQCNLAVLCQELSSSVVYTAVVHTAVVQWCFSGEAMSRSSCVRRSQPQFIVCSH